MKNVLRVLIVTAVVSLGLTVASRVHGQSTAVGSYPPGWSMVGGPPGTDFSGAAALDAYGPNGYFTPAGRLAALCQGYWADFLSAHTVPLVGYSAPTVTCALQTGWNLIGNPFSVLATLPTGTLAYYWDPLHGHYDTVGSIPIGGSVWIYASSSSNVVLQTASIPPVSATPAPTITIFNLFSPTPYTLHVGDTIELQLGNASPFRASADPQYLHLISAGTTGELSCVTDPACALSLLNNFWLWQAVQPGTTTITATPECRFTTPQCGTPDMSVQINIVP